MIKYTKTKYGNKIIEIYRKEMLIILYNAGVQINARKGRILKVNHPWLKLRQRNIFTCFSNGMKLCFWILSLDKNMQKGPGLGFRRDTL